MSENWIWGRHSVEACLENCPEHILEIYRDKKGGSDGTALFKKAESMGLKVLEAMKMPKAVEGKRHQSVAAQLKRFPFKVWKDIQDTLASQCKNPSYRAVFLDRIQDPQNYGAILRSALGLGIDHVFVGQQKQSPLTGVVAQASAGALFVNPPVLCPSPVQVLDRLKELGTKIYALDSEGRSIRELNFSLPTLWLLGAEGEGLRDNLAEKADQRIAIPLDGGLESLNASVAAAIAFWSARGH